VPLELPSSLWGIPHSIVVDSNLAHFAGLAYGDGYPGWGEVRIVTSNSVFAERLVGIVGQIATQYGGTSREYVRPGNLSDSLQHNIVLNSTLVRRALFDDLMQPNYDSIHALAMDEELAVHVQGGLSDAESSLLLPEPIESPHGRIFAIINSDRRLLGIARLSLVNKIRLEPGSVRTRLANKRGRRHTVRGIEIVTRKNGYLIEILAGAKRKWLTKVGSLLWHPEKQERARLLLSTYPA
jgi:hypothetical protein